MIVYQDKIKLPLETKVWRYMDFEKFIVLLNSSSLHFTRIDKLGDNLESIIPSEIIANSKNQYPKSNPEEFSNSIHKHRNQLRVNCWHIGKDESVAMWKIYCSNNLGVAIETTLKRIIDSFQGGSERIHLEKINYDGFDKDYFCHANLLYPAINKLASYRFENELRLIFYGSDTDGQLSARTKETENGNLIRIELDKLIDSICLSPNVPEGFENIIEHLREKNSMKFKIHKSIINDSSVHFK